MVDYVHAWKVRKIQIIIVNIFFLLIGIGIAVNENDIRTGLTVWFFGSWVVETIISSFTKGGGMLSSLGLNAISLVFNGSFAAATGWTLFGVFFLIAVIRLLIGIIVIVIALALEFVLFPFTTLYYFLKAREARKR